MSQEQPKGLAAVIDVLREKYDWKLDQEIGRGGFGVVFREQVNGMMRAVKITLDPLDRLTAGLSDVQRQQALQREREALELLTRIGNHPHLLTLISWEEVLGHLVTVWEYAADGTLLDRLREHQRQNGQCGLPLDQLIPWMEQAAEGLEFLNSRGIYHRDIKPQNLFLVGEQVKVGDLGFLKLAGLSTASQTGVGTVGYLPLEAYPRSANEKGRLHETIDVYGLAATYVHLRTGKPPFGTSELMIIDRQKRGQPCTDGMTPAEAEWVRQALSPRPDQRPRSVREFVRELGNRLSASELSQRVSIREFGFSPSPIELRIARPRQVEGSTLPPLPRELAQAQAQLLALPELIRQVQDGTHPALQRHWQVVQQAEQQLQQLKAALQATPLPTGLSVADAQTIFKTLQRDPEASLVGLYRLAGNVSRWAFAHWLKMAKSCVLAQRQYEQLRQQYLSYAHEQLQRMQQLLERLKEEVGRLQYRDLVQLLAGYRARIGTGSETLPVELWIQLGPELERRYIGWNAQTLLEQAEWAWGATVQFLKQQRRRRRLRLVLGLLILVLAFILGILVYAWPPSLQVSATQPDQPVAGEPWEVEFRTWSLWGRPVSVEWRYAGETQWQRLEEPKLRIPEIKADSLALEFRPVDSKGFLGNAIQQRVYVPVPTLKITKQDPPNGPIAGEPFTIEFEATSPVGRTVHVEWRYAGDTQWRRLSEQKLHIAEVKGDALALEFRAVDSKDFIGSALEGRWRVLPPAPSLKITKQDPPNGPIAGDPFTIEFEATSPAGRTVHVEWRYAGDTQWQRLSEQKLHIPEVKGETLALEFRAVDSKGFASTVSPYLLLVFADKDSYARREVRLFTGHENRVWSVAVTPDGKYVVSGSDDKTVRLWDLATGKEVRRFTGHWPSVYSVAVTPNDKYVVSGSGGYTVRVWELATGKEVRELTAHEGSVNSVAVTPDGKYVVSGSGDKTVRLWDLATGKEVRRFTGHGDSVRTVAVTPDGKYVVSGSWDNTVRLWELATGQEVRRFTAHEGWVRSVAVTPDGQYVVSGGYDNTVRLWELATGKEVRRFTGHRSAVSSVAVTPDGKYVVSGSDDNTVRLWDLATGKEVRRFTGHGDSVRTVAVTPDGKYVVSGSGDETVRVWYIGDLK